MIGLKGRKEYYMGRLGVNFSLRFGVHTNTLMTVLVLAWDETVRGFIIATHSTLYLFSHLILQTHFLIHSGLSVFFCWCIWERRLKGNFRCKVSLLARCVTKIDGLDHWRNGNLRVCHAQWMKFLAIPFRCGIPGWGPQWYLQQAWAVYLKSYTPWSWNSAS